MLAVELIGPHQPLPRAARPLAGDNAPFLPSAACTAGGALGLLTALQVSLRGRDETVLRPRSMRAWGTCGIVPNTPPCWWRAATVPMRWWRIPGDAGALPVGDGRAHVDAAP